MTSSAAQSLALVREILAGIAPESDGADIPGHADLREALDLDSMDFLNFIIALHEQTGIDIPEMDYPQLFTLDGIVAYLAQHGRR